MKEIKTVTIYRCTSESRCQFGRQDAFTLDEPQNISRIWYDPEEYILPDGFEVAECVDGSSAIYNTAGEHCILTAGYNNQPVLIDTTGIHAIKNAAALREQDNGEAAGK
ncbi:hypothetical protein [Anaeromassilibacillus senegalensis]|uniref:hypothetical protein n=1 Tax=Anaeromassilibacillus senegalensis TaxID=1673717 RepID=UPI000680BB11|nr:hypothetical protein [Anaeromassilibacillus senegalensis]